MIRDRKVTFSELIWLLPQIILANLKSLKRKPYHKYIPNEQYNKTKHLFIHQTNIA